MSGVQSDILLRLLRWRQRLARVNDGDREVATRLVTVSRAAEEITTLRATNDVLRTKLTTLETIVTGRGRR